MIIEYIRARLAEISEVAAWPEMMSLIGRTTDPASMPCWEYPVMACRAVGGTKEQALPGTAAIFCLLYSMHLVDDLLDEDPRGLQHKLGVGQTANLGLAFQAAASILIERTDLPADRRSMIHASLARTALGTAYGQNLDLSEAEGENGYWQVVETKTPPLFSAALYIGAILGGAPENIARDLEKLGFTLGKSVQVSDDLKDSLAKPAKPDWNRRSNNLPILYAMTAGHPERDRFLGLLPRVADPEALQEAQEILVTSGAVSFCSYHMIELHKGARACLQAIPLEHPESLRELLDYHIGPLRSLFESIGVDSPDELLA